MSSGPSTAGRLAVLIPVLNEVEALAQTLASVDAQEGDFDIVVVDDGSQPPVAIETATYRHALVLLRQDRNRGVTAALNVGLRHILARPYAYVVRQDAGDMDQSDRIATQLAYLEAHPEVALVGAWTSHIDTKGQPLFVTRYPAEAHAIRQRLRYCSAFSHPTSMMRTSALRVVGLYDEGVDLAQDYDLFWRLARLFPVANIPRVLVIKQEMPSSITITRRGTASWHRLRIQCRYFSFVDVNAYLGLLRSVLIYPVPPRLIVAVKRRLRPAPSGQMPLPSTTVSTDRHMMPTSWARSRKTE